MRCPLCQNSGADLFHRDFSREFFLCSACTIIFVPRTSLLSAAEEKIRYDAHRNDESDLRYQGYLLKTVDPVIGLLSPESRGLDFGCGRTRLMEKLFRDRALEVDSYDPFYFPDESIWNRRYDFVVMNEVIEHLADPHQVISQLRDICAGPLFVRTKLYPGTESDFSDWFYKRDLTHVQFFSQKALRFIGPTEEIDTDLYRIELK